MKIVELFSRLERHTRVMLFIVIPLVSFLLHLPFLGTDLQGIHAWRQCETASNVIRFAEEGFQITQPHVYSMEWEGGLKQMEFPIMQYVMGLAVKWFGHEIVVMRVMSWLIGCLAMWGIFALILALLRDRTVALLGAWAFSFSPLVFYYTINPLPDNLALAGGIWSLALTLRFVHEKRQVWTWLSAICLLVAVLAKLPFIVFGALPAVYFLGMLLRKDFKAGLLAAVPFLLILIPIGAWYLKVIPTWHGNGVVKGILDSSVSDIPEILDILLHHVISTLPELMLNYAALPFFFMGLYAAFSRKGRSSMHFWPWMGLFAGCLAYFTFEINMIGKAHDYYLFPFLPGLFVLVTLGIRWLMQLGKAWNGYMVFILLLIVPFTACIRAYPRWQKRGFPAELVENKAALQKAVPANAKILAGHDLSPHIFIYHLKHQGWTLSKDEVDAERVKKCIAAGAEYLYSSDRSLEENAALAPHIGELVEQVGRIRVYKLKP